MTLGGGSMGAPGWWRALGALLAAPVPDRATWVPAFLGAVQAAGGTPLLRGEDELTWAWHGRAGEVRLGGVLFRPLARVEGTDLWLLTARVPGAAGARFGYSFCVDGQWRFADPLNTRQVAAGWTAGDMPVWEGPRAAPRPAGGGAPAGRREAPWLWSHALAEERPVTIYLPPGYPAAAPYPLLLAGDGQWYSSPAVLGLMDRLWATGQVRPFVLAAVHAPRDAERRAAEYLPGAGTRFNLLLRFLAAELSPWLDGRYALSPDPGERVCIGTSNSAAMALEMVLRCPDRFGAAVAQSVAGFPRHLSVRNLTAAPGRFGFPAGGAAVPEACRCRFYLVAGTLEEPFLRNQQEVARMLARRSVHHRTVEWVGGHEPVSWQDQLPGALAWAFGPG